MSCEVHSSLNGRVKASLKEGRYFVCLSVWCDICGHQFEMSDTLEVSLDGTQLLVEVKPVTMLIAEGSALEC